MASLAHHREHPGEKKDIKYTQMMAQNQACIRPAVS